MPSFGADLAAGGAGAVAGMSAAGPIGAAALGGIDFLASVFGGSDKPREDPITAQSRQMQLGAQRALYQQAQGVPGADPASMAALAQDRGQLGAAQRQQSQQLMGAWNPAQGTNGLADMMKNLTSNQTAQQMSLSESHLMNALYQRQQALQSVISAGSRVQGPTYQPQSNLPQLLGQISQGIAYQMGRGKNGGQGAAGSTDNQPVNVPFTGSYGAGTMAGPANPLANPGLWQAGGFSPAGAQTAGTSGAIPQTTGAAPTGFMPQPDPTVSAGVPMNLSTPTPISAMDYSQPPGMQPSAAVQSLNGQNPYNQAQAGLQNQLRQSWLRY